MLLSRELKIIIVIIVTTTTMASLGDAVLSNIQCPVCYAFLTEPKLLACSHNFCEKCLTHLISEKQQFSLPCPVCRFVTNIKDGDVSRLPTNLPLKEIVSSFEGNNNENVVCASTTVDCGKVEETENVEKNNGEKLSINDSDAIKNEIDRKKKICSEHDEHEGTDYCITCTKYICFRCRMLDHNGHTVKSAVEYESSLRTETRSQRATDDGIFESHDVGLMKGTKHLKTEAIELKSMIEQNYQESIRKMNERKLFLIKQCTEGKEKIILGMKSTAETGITVKGSKCSSLGKVSVDHHETSFPVDTIIDDLLCLGLKCALRDQIQRHITSDEKKKSIQIISVHGDRVNEMKTRVVEFEMKDVRWQVKSKVALHAKCSMECLVATPCGLMLVGYSPGGIEVYSSDGSLQEKALFDVNVRALGILSDGRYVVRNTKNVLSLYTTMWDKDKVKFDTLDQRGGHGGLTVDNEDNIYVTFTKAMKIQVFCPRGGLASRELSCDGYVPMQICASRTGKRLVVKSSRNSVRVINDEGTKEYNIVGDRNVIVHSALCADDTILIATLSKGTNSVTIERFSDDFRQKSSIVIDQEIELTDRKWFCLQGFSSGDIAFCTPNRLHVFHKD